VPQNYCAPAPFAYAITNKRIITAQKINTKVHETIDKLKSAKEQSSQPVSSGGPAADELKKFKELLDTEIISEEEFNKKKETAVGVIKWYDKISKDMIYEQIWGEEM
jgi:hypothetical protein